MTHLGDRVASLIDGQLPVDVSGKAMTHLAACPACQEAADLERLTKQRLASLGTPQPGADLIRRLLDLSEGTQGPLPPRPGYLAGGSRSSSFTNASWPGSLPGSAGSPGSAPNSAGSAGSAGFAGSGLGGSRSGPSQPMVRTDPSTRPPGRRPAAAQTRPPGAAPGATHRLSRTTRSRLAFAVAGAACLVGVGVAGGVAAGQAPPPSISPPVDSFVVQGGTVPVNLPLEKQAARLSMATAHR